MDSSQKEFIIENVELTFAVNYSEFGVLAFLLYDTVLLFDNEVNYFWQRPKNLLSYVYFITRYSGILSVVVQLIYNPSNATQEMWYNTFSHLSSYSITEGNTFYLSSMLEVLSIMLIDYILLLRVRALYSKGRGITIILAIAFAIEGISLTVIGIQSAIEEKPQPFPLAPGITYCREIVQGLAEDVISWCIPLVYGILLMTLAVDKSTKMLKEDPGLNTDKIIKIIVRDQVVYFMSLILISASGIASNFLPSSVPVLVVFESLGNTAILSSVGARLLLNMKVAGAKGLNEGMGSSISKSTVSGMDFAEAPAQTSFVSGGADAPVRNSVVSGEAETGGMNEEIGMVEV